MERFVLQDSSLQHRLRSLLFEAVMEDTVNAPQIIDLV
jgi:hypothetical protein